MDEWQPNLGTSVPAPHIGLKHKRWRVSSYEALSERTRRMMWRGVEGIVAELPFPLRSRVLDVELCGSYVFGNADLASDLDFCMVMEKRHVRDAYDQLMGGNKFHNAIGFAKKINAVSAQLGIEIEIVPGISNKENGVPCVRKSDGKIYNKRWGKVLDRVKYFYNKDTEKFEPGVKPDRRVEFDGDDD